MALASQLQLPHRHPGRAHQPVGWVQTLNLAASVYSTFDLGPGNTFSQLKQFAFL